MRLSAVFEKCPATWDTYPRSTPLMVGSAGEARGLLQATQRFCPSAQGCRASASFSGAPLKTQVSNWGQVAQESRHRAEDGERRGEALGEHYQAFTSPLLALPSPAAVGFVLLADRGEQDHRLQPGRRRTLPVRAGSSSSSAEMS